LLHVDPVPKTSFVEEMPALEDHAVIVAGFIEANIAHIAIYPLVFHLPLLGNVDNGQGGKDFSVDFL
jgi:cytochrome b561